MAVLRELTQGRRVRPAARCLVGRAQHCHLVLGDSDASREHAVIFYDARGWHVRDLSSRNGTVVHGVRVKDVVALERGSEIGFGAASNAWVLDDADPPAARAISQTTGQALLAGPSGLQLPGTAPCEAYVSSQDGQWLLERSGEVRPVSDKEQLRLANDIWLLELTVGDERPTAPTATLEGLQTHLIFKVSRNEEHVELTVERGGRLHVFAHRSHTYLLLLLARARLEDQRSAGASTSEHGWIETEKLAIMLRTTSEQVNVWIWRAREQLASVDIVLAQELVERRPNLGELRIGFGSLAIMAL